MSLGGIATGDHLGAGAHGRSAFLHADSLITAYHATVADISEPLG